MAPCPHMGAGLVKQCPGSCGRQLAPGGGQDPSGWACFRAANPCRLAGTARVRVCSQGSEGGKLPSSLLSPPPWTHLHWDCFQWVVLALLSQSPEHCGVTLMSAPGPAAPKPCRGAGFVGRACLQRGQGEQLTCPAQPTLFLGYEEQRCPVSRPGPADAVCKLAGR